MISFMQWLISLKKGFLVTSPEVKNPVLQILNPLNEGENVLFDNGAIRVTPTFIHISEDKRIVVSQIRGFQCGRIQENSTSWVIWKVMMILFISGVILTWILQKWVYFSLCMFGLLKAVWMIWKWPYCVSIRTSGLFGEYIEFSDRKAVDACGKAIEAAIKIGVK